MVHISLRQKRPGATEQNTFERHTNGPGNPLTELPGDGFYDWAGRRLFLPNGRPDPNTPGAYRYQHDPDCTDPTAPDSDPASPRYEPPHLRHRPGDTYEIGGKPDDPADPGPYGTPGWYQDTRTGRHRRGELPDPLPPEPEVEASTKPTRLRLPTTPARPRPEPRPRHFWFDPEPEEPYQFSKLREDAWDRWLIDSAPLAAAHTRPNREHSRTTGVLRRLSSWIADQFTGGRYSKETPEPVAPETPTEPTVRLPRPPAEPLLPKPRTGNGYIGSWELAFDTRHSVRGGHLA